MATSFQLINKLAKINGATTYLEIGVFKGGTFVGVTIPNKYAVDPNFLFDYVPLQNDKTHFFSQTSDIFFEELAKAQESAEEHVMKDIKFDIIFLDGLHTFEQAWRDFVTLLPYTHEQTIIVFDDTLPSDPYSCIPSQTESYYFRTIDPAIKYLNYIFIKCLSYNDIKKSFFRYLVAGSIKPELLANLGMVIVIKNLILLMCIRCSMKYGCQDRRTLIALQI